MKRPKRKDIKRIVWHDRARKLQIYKSNWSQILPSFHFIVKIITYKSVCYAQNSMGKPFPLVPLRRQSERRFILSTWEESEALPISAKHPEGLSYALIPDYPPIRQESLFNYFREGGTEYSTKINHTHSHPLRN